LLAVAVAHYAITTTALLACLGSPLPWRRTFLAQLGATTANRVPPAGLGGAAVRLRYLSRRGFSTPRAVGCVASTRLLGSLGTTVVTLVAVLSMGGSLHVPHVPAWLASPFAVATVLVCLVATGWVAQARLRGTGVCLQVSVAAALAGPRQLLRSPRRAAVVALAGPLTAVVIASGLLASVAVTTGSLRPATVVPLVLGYAVGGAAPVPGGGAPRTWACSPRSARRGSPPIPRSSRCACSAR
jgi:hypothetical protein